MWTVWPSTTKVALRKESVDRNILSKSAIVDLLVALRKESVDRNPINVMSVSAVQESLSARRAWIDIISERL